MAVTVKSSDTAQAHAGLGMSLRSGQAEPSIKGSLAGE